MKEITKTLAFLISMIFLILRYETNGENLIRNRIRREALPFKCPVDCSSNTSYKPICSRGKSYANLCALQRQICEGNAAKEIYKDVEDCPKYEEKEDREGASVETVDKNGVKFRNLLDSVETTQQKEVSSHEISSDYLQSVKKGSGIPSEGNKRRRCWN